MSNTIGYGVGASVNLAPEVTPGTAPNVSTGVWLPFTSEAIKASRPVIESGTITGDRSIRKRLAGVRSGAGEINMEIDGSNIGPCLNYFNGNASGAYTASTVPAITAAPGGSIGAGGALPAGVYYYKVQLVYKRTSDLSLWSAKGSASSASFTSASTNNTATLTWTDPATLTPPTGFTVGGVAIYRTAVGGAAGTETFLTYQASPTLTGYADIGSGYVGSGSGAVVHTQTVYQHLFARAFTPGANPLPSFTTTVIKDNDLSEQFLLCRMNSMEFVIGDGNQPAMAKFGLMARDYQSIANPTASISNLRKFMAWQSQISIDGTYSDLVQAFTISANNNCELVPGLSGQPRYRDVGYGKRAIEVSLSRGFEDHAFWTAVRNGSRFALNMLACGQPVVETAGYSFDAVGSGLDADMVYPFRYSMSVNVPVCSLSEGGANVGGPGRMVESIKCGAEVDEGTGHDMVIKLYNLTATYA